MKLLKFEFYTNRAAGYCLRLFLLQILCSFDIFCYSICFESELLVRFSLAVDVVRVVETIRPLSGCMQIGSSDKHYLLRRIGLVCECQKFRIKTKPSGNWSVLSGELVEMGKAYEDLDKDRAMSDDREGRRIRKCVHCKQYKINGISLRNCCNILILFFARLSESCIGPLSPMID